MDRLLFAAAFLLGSAAVLWMGSTFSGADILALGVIGVIACVYCIGFLELLQFRRATATLSTALHDPQVDPASGPDSLNRWLERLHPSLQNATRLRIEGERVGLPAPVMTPYLVGLLVMLGLLGTFVGMVETLQGAVLALEGTTELQAIRAGLAAPIEGLSLAFGTSVAGVAASAMLGLASTLSRRDRMLATRQLDNRISTVFREFSLAHYRRETHNALQLQAAALPEVAATLSTLADKLGQMGEQLGARLVADQAQFHQSTQRGYTELAASVEQSLKESLAASGRLVGDSMRPLVQELMTGVGDEVQETHRELSRGIQQHLVSLEAQFAATSQEVSAAWQAGLRDHQQCNRELLGEISASLTAAGDRLREGSGELLSDFDSAASAWTERQSQGDSERLAQWTDSLVATQEQAALRLAATATGQLQELRELSEIQQRAFTAANENFAAMATGITDQWRQSGGRMDALITTLKNELGTLRDEEASRGEAAVSRLAELETVVASHLANLGRELEQPMTRLIETASETPRAAADVIARLRTEISNNLERDNTLLDERQRLMENLRGLSAELAGSASAQRDAIEELVGSTANALQAAVRGITDQSGAHTSKLADAAVIVAGSASEMSSLGEAFGVAVNLFSESNGALIATLDKIEQALENSTARSDEQMGYYLAQAREIIDQSLLSQQAVFARLDPDQQPGPVPAEAG